MGVLAFGDSSTWALPRDGSTTGALATAKARRAARFGDGTVPESREADGADGPGRAGVTPRNAWPEGTFTITYPRGYDPARGGFVRGGEGDEEARVRVEKAPARARREAEAALEARRASAEAASRSAAEALGLDEAYLERVRAQRREAPAPQSCISGRFGYWSLKTTRSRSRCYSTSSQKLPRELSLSGCLRSRSR